jgi:hypothetical protein
MLQGLLNLSTWASQGLLNLGYRKKIEELTAAHTRLSRSGRIDSWNSCDECTKLYRPKLRHLAVRISDLSQEDILTRYNLGTDKIELYGSKTREIIALVKICFEGRDPHAIVETSRHLHAMPENLKALFVDALLMDVEFR